MLASVESLLRENQTELLTERRSVDRRPFVRPVTIRTGKLGETAEFAFSRDISPNGIGLISMVEWPSNSVATLDIQSIRKPGFVTVTAEVRWTKTYGDNWFFTGWRFLEDELPKRY